MRPFVVLKFGGTSVATAECWQTITDVVLSRLEEGVLPVLVCSALAGVSDALDGLLDAALGGAGEGSHQAVLDALGRQHRELAADLGVPFDEQLDETLLTLNRLAVGASLTEEVTPRLRARVMAKGEILSTRLGAAYLESRGLPVAFLDARKCLCARADERGGASSYLSATCDVHADPALAERLRKLERPVITQGFIAQNAAGETVLLGRGGSDTSAAYFAARLSAVRCEIWTDVPGIYTANPRDVPEARLLRRLDYDEAQEVATTGAKVLHPRCIAPLRRHGIPLHIRCTLRPEMEGTVICADVPQTADVKAISAKRGVTLISMNTLGMWQQVGFLADVFACFRARGVSVDLVSTSEANVTASFDPAAGAVDQEVIGGLLGDLSAYCSPSLIGPCAAVSLVGRNIRAILHRLGPALQVFEEHRIHLVSQAASDLNLTFVIDEPQADRLVARLHAMLFGDRSDDAHLGPAWKETFETETAIPPDVTDPPWWAARSLELIEIAAAGTPAYVYDLETIETACADLLAIEAIDRVFYAVKANDHPAVLRRIVAAGLGLECVSPGELEHVRGALGQAFDPTQVLFTPNFAGREEYAAGLELGVFVTIDNLHPLEAWPELFGGRELVLRIDPGRGRGHHVHVRTAGPQSKFGIAPDQLDLVAAALARAEARVVGLHAHAGSGIRTADAWRDTALFLIDVAARFKEVRFLDLGGGLGVPEKPGQAHLDLDAVASSLAMVKAAHPRFELWLEPGRFVVAPAGVLLCRVTQVKQKGDLRYVGVDAGMNSLIRPALYGAWHEIINLSRLDEPRSIIANVVGPICETGDTLGYQRRLPPTHEGDLLLVATTGAYGRTMSSNYNRRPPAREITLESPRM